MIKVNGETYERFNKLIDALLDFNRLVVEQGYHDQRKELLEELFYMTKSAKRVQEFLRKELDNEVDRMAGLN